jgi:hypothetical protein
MQTRAFLAQDALYDALKAATFPGRVAVSLGSPTQLETDHIWVSGSIEEWPSTYRVSGLAARDEEFSLRVFVWVKRLGRFTDARARATALGSVVEQVILSDHTLDGTVDLATLARTSLEDAVDQEARSYVCLLGFSIDCMAYIPNA